MTNEASITSWRPSLVTANEGAYLFTIGCSHAILAVADSMGARSRGFESFSSCAVRALELLSNLISSADSIRSRRDAADITNPTLTLHIRFRRALAAVLTDCEDSERCRGLLSTPLIDSDPQYPHVNKTRVDNEDDGSEVWA